MCFFFLVKIQSFAEEQLCCLTSDSSFNFFSSFSSTCQTLMIMLLMIRQLLILFCFISYLLSLLLYLIQLSICIVLIFDNSRNDVQQEKHYFFSLTNALLEIQTFSCTHMKQVFWATTRIVCTLL